MWLSLSFGKYQLAPVGDFLSNIHFLDWISGQTYTLDEMRMRKLDCRLRLAVVWRDCLDGVRKAKHMHVPTAISRRHEGVTKGSKLAPSGRPPKCPLDDDPSVQTKRGRLEHVKRKQNLRLNELQNQTNHHKWSWTLSLEFTKTLIGLL